nr:MAG TPA: hypothetical protein [Caudoviricetes sp.]DAM43701.1 MAG TPA: hypothetical protein [Caudoviricetes sp.]
MLSSNILLYRVLNVNQFAIRFFVFSDIFNITP